MGTELESMSTRYPSNAVAWYTVSVLSFVYLFSFLDRQIMVLLIDPIKAELGISDTQVSLLTGLAFAGVYAVMGVPMGRAADKFPRRIVIGLGIIVWSIMTIGCGFARSFAQMFVARMGVGIGEAALTPAAFGIIPDLFPPNRLARGMAVFMMASSIGTGVSLLVGGAVLTFVESAGAITIPFLGEMTGWRIVFLAVGIPSLLTVFLLATIREPVRQMVPTNHREAGGSESLMDVFKYMWKERRAFTPMMVGFPVLGISFYGSLSWAPVYFMRVHGWNPGQAGLIIGSISAVFGVIGTFSGAWIGDAVRARNYYDAPLRVILFAMLFGAPFAFTMALSSNTTLAISAFAIYFAFKFSGTALAPAAVQTVAPGHMRAQIAAIYLMVANLIAIGLGPTAIALVTDYVFHDDLAVGKSIAVVGAITSVIGAFAIWWGMKPFRIAAKELHEGAVATNPEE